MLSLQQNAERSAEARQQSRSSETLTALPSIRLEMANCVRSRLRWQLRHSDERKRKGSYRRRRNMTFIPTQTGFMRLEDSASLLHAIFPNYPSLEPCYPAPPLEAIAESGADRRN